MKTQTIVDTHAHLHDQEFSADFDAVIVRAQEAGVERIVLIGEDVENSALAASYARNTPMCWAAAGVHPHRASAFRSETIDQLWALIAREHKIVAIGEIGLDLHYNFATYEEQLAAFEAQLKLARETRLPVVIHCREAYPQALEILQRFSPETEQWPWGVMHCYFGNLDQARAFYEMGLLLGIGGSVTFRKTEIVHEVVRSMPLESMVLETDAPYMAPVPHRGKRNEPAYLSLVVNRIAELKEVSPEEVAHQTTVNTFRLFRWE